MPYTKPRKKKNKTLPLIVLVGVLCGLVIAYLALSSANDKKEAEEAALAAQDTTIMLAEMDSSAITQLAYRYSDNDWITLNQSGGVWTWDDDAHYPLDQTTAASLGSAIASIGAIRTVDEGEAADYGLDEPICEIHVSYGEGTTYKYAIGDRNSFNDAYYFRDDDGSFYMIASGLLTYFQTELDDMIVLDTALSTTAEGDLVSFTLADGENTATFTQTTTEVEDEDGNTTTTYDEDVTALYDLFCELNLKNYADYYADSTEMAESYGIDESCSLTLTYKKSVTVSSSDDSSASSTTKVDANYTIYFGDTVDGQTYYSPKGSTIVYVAADDVVTEILGYLGE